VGARRGGPSFSIPDTQHERQRQVARLEAHLARPGRYCDHVARYRLVAIRHAIASYKPTTTQLFEDMLRDHYSADIKVSCENPVLALFRRARAIKPAEPGGQAPVCKAGEAGSTPDAGSLCEDCGQPAARHASSCWLSPREQSEGSDTYEVRLQIWPLTAS
jgi:hypothetical protein